MSELTGFAAGLILGVVLTFFVMVGDTLGSDEPFGAKEYYQCSLHLETIRNKSNLELTETDIHCIKVLKYTTGKEGTYGN